jgi:hypothetical protein
VAEITSQASILLRFTIDFESVTKSLVDKSDLVSVWRPCGAFSEACQDLYIVWQAIEGASILVVHQGS